MIIATKTVDSTIKGIVSPDKLMITRLDSIETSLQLDPNLLNPKREMFIISSDDLKNPKVRHAFMESLKKKHPECMIMYINKIGREFNDIDTTLFDFYLVKPKKEDVKLKFTELVNALESKEKSTGKAISKVEEFNIEDSVPKQDMYQEEEPEPVVTLNIPKEVPITKPLEVNTELNLLSRIKQSEDWASINAIAAEVSASKIVKEIAESNASFKHSETYVLALSENITSILSNREYSTQERLSKVRAILHDKAYISAKNNSIIEQSVEQIITAIVDKAKEEVLSKTEELDERIIYAFKNRSALEAPNVRLSTIIEQRSKLLIELTALDLELKGIASNCNSTIDDTVDNVISSSVSSTGSPILDSQVKARFGDIVPENLITVLDNLFKVGKESNDEFSKLSLAVNSTVRKLYSLLSYYQEESEVLSNTIRYLKANNIENTVIANTILKKTSRLYISCNDYDSVAMAYLISKNNSRKSNNVLLIDISGSPALHEFNIPMIPYSRFMNEDRMDSKFTVVSTYGDDGTVVESDTDYVRLSSRISHYAKHYSMINILCSDEQSCIIDSIKEDVLSITYLVDCYPSSIRRMATCIERTCVPNTANKVILMNYLSDSNKICNTLNILNRLDMQLATVKPILELRSCILNKQDPFDVESILKDSSNVFSVC